MSPIRSRSLSRHRRGSPRRRPAARALRWAVERLESRAVPATIVVTSAADTTAVGGGVTLRAAIESVNAGANVGDVMASGAYGTDDTINFDIPGGFQFIRVIGEGLPAIRKTVTIDGLTQPGSTPNAPQIQLDGGATSFGASGLTLQNVSGCRITGFDITSFNANASVAGIRIVGGSGNSIADNFIGINATGSAAGAGTLRNRTGVIIKNSDGNLIGSNLISGNTEGDGVVVDGNDNAIASNRIGTALTGLQSVPNLDGVTVVAGTGNIVENNVISGNDDAGVIVSSAGNRITGNLIGTTASGTAALANAHDGIELFVTAPDTIIDGDLVSGNGGHGIVVDGANNIIASNSIGTDINGQSAIPNAGHGILFRVAAVNNIAAGNTIAFNGRAGVVVKGAGSIGNRIVSNSIFANGRLGIDLGDNGVTPNTPNNPLNFPVLDQAEIEEGSTELTVVGVAPPGSTVQFFIADPDPSGFGEGKTYLGNDTEGSAYDLDPSIGGFRFVIPLSMLGIVGEGTLITATATSAAGTSEFSANLAVTALPPPIEPPVEPPIEPPVEPPIEPPTVDPPIDPPPTEPPPIDPPIEPPPIEPPPVPPPVTVVALHRYGFHDQPTHVVLIFSNALEAVSAQDLANYKLTVLMGGHPVTLRIKSATYDPASLTVTLRTQQLLPLKFSYSLAVDGILDGLGRPVVPFMQTFGREALAGPNRR
jgi:parallel beta-helix repeat protein